MPTAAEVESVLSDLVARLERVDPAYRAMLPARRTIEAVCPDLDLVFHAQLSDGRLSALKPGPAPRADIRFTVDSADLIAMAAGELAFREAYLGNRMRLDASMTDLLRLRAAL